MFFYAAWQCLKKTEKFIYATNVGRFIKKVIVK